MWSICIAVFFLCLSCTSCGRVFIKPDWQYSFEGYLKHETLYDSRQNIGDDDNQALLFPKRSIYDTNGIDVNARGQLDMFCLESRVLLSAQGPPINSVIATAIIVSDFFGRNNIAHLLTIRLAYFTLESGPFKTLIGYGWHPFCFEDYFCNVVSNNSGTPFAADSRASQIRFSYTYNNNTLLCAFIEQLDFASDGPFGINSIYIRNAHLPNIHLQLQHLFGHHCCAFALDFKKISPRIVTNNFIKTNESLYSYAGAFLIALKWPDTLTIFSTFSIAQNPTNFGFIGGYDVYSIDPITDKRTYKNITAACFWSDIEVVTYKNIIPGLFIGYTKNISTFYNFLSCIFDPNTNELVDRRTFGIGNDSNIIVRAAPRVRVLYNAITFAIELEYTRALYENTSLYNNNPVANVRGILAVYYNF